MLYEIIKNVIVKEERRSCCEKEQEVEEGLY